MAAMARGPRKGRITGFRCDEAEAQVTQRASALGVFLTERVDLERALREARRASRGGAAHYDPARHVALLRMLRRVAMPGAAHAPASAAHNKGTLP